MSDSKYSYIAELVEEEAPMEEVIYEALIALGIGGQVREFISELVFFAKDHDLESRETPLAILNDAFKEVAARF